MYIVYIYLFTKNSEKQHTTANFLPMPPTRPSYANIRLSNRRGRVCQTKLTLLRTTTEIFPPIWCSVFFLHCSRLMEDRPYKRTRIWAGAAWPWTWSRKYFQAYTHKHTHTHTWNVMEATSMYSGGGGGLLDTYNIEGALLKGTEVVGVGCLLKSTLLRFDSYVYSLL